MNDNLDDKTLRDYATGALSGDALRSFEQRLQTEPDLQTELDLYLALKAADNLRLKKQLREVAAGEQLTPSTPRPAVVRQLSVWLAAAASVALLLTAVWWWQQSAKPDAAALAQTYLATPYPPPVTTMGEADTLSAALQRAFLAYRTGDFTSAAQQLSALSEAPGASDETLFYAGEALLQTGQLERALAYFDRVGPGYWRESADWRSALALLNNGQADRARVLLNKLRNTRRKEQAEALLRAME